MKALLLWAAAAFAVVSVLAREQRDPHPLVIDAGFFVPTPPEGQTPIAIPDPNALYAPCPMTPRNTFPLQERDA